MEVVSKPCQDQFLHPIPVHYRKIRKIQVDKWGKPKIYLKKNRIQQKKSSLNFTLKHPKTVLKFCQICISFANFVPNLPNEQKKCFSSCSS